VVLIFDETLLQHWAGDEVLHQIVEVLMGGLKLGYKNSWENLFEIYELLFRV
jgi:hypothetical protein